MELGLRSWDFGVGTSELGLESWNTTGPGWFEFDKPVARFGAWWNNNGGEDGAMVEFFDAAGAPIATANATAAGNVWVWNAWQSEVPIGSIRVTGFGLLDGFIWFDDLQLAYPQPTCDADLSMDGDVDGDDPALQRPLASSRGGRKWMFCKEKRSGWGAGGPAAGRQAPDASFDAAERRFRPPQQKPRGAVVLGTLLAAWGSSGPGDLDGDGVADAEDLAALLAAWGPCPQ